MRGVNQVDALALIHPTKNHTYFRVLVSPVGWISAAHPPIKLRKLLYTIIQQHYEQMGKRLVMGDPLKHKFELYKF